MKNKEFLNKLSLESLTIPDFDSDEMKERMRKVDAEIAPYREKYGDEWHIHYAQDKGLKYGRFCGYDRYMKMVNSAIYFGSHLGMSSRFGKMQEERMHELFGDEYGVLRTHVKGDSRVVDLLLKDALKTGKWKELPDDLQSEYHKLAGELM